MKTRLAVALFLAAAAAPAVAVAAESSMLAATALERLDLALTEGRLDPAEHALLAFRLLKAPKTMPAEFRPTATESPLRCGTLIARRAFLLQKEGAFDASQAAELAALGGRPNMPTQTPVMDNGGTVRIGTIHSTAAVPAGTVNNVVLYFRESWEAQFGTMGWRPPPGDFGAGGTGSNPGVEYDLYLDPNEFGAYTQPTPENGPEPWNDSPSFIVLQSDVPNIETYVAHELNHASQFAYDYAEGDFIYEATATWMEDKVYDSVNDYTFFIADFQRAPSETLSYATYSNSYMYGGAVFFHYLSDVYDAGGTAVVRNVWDFAKNGSNDWYDGVEDALAGEGFSGIADIYTEFAGFRLLTKSRGDGSFDEENNFDNVSLEASYSIDDLENGTTSDPPMGMGANYIVVNSFGADAGEALTLSISSRDPGPWAITAVAIPAAGSAQITVFNDEDDDGKVEATVENAGTFTQVGFAITNTSNANEGVDSSQGGGVTRTPHDFSWSFGGGGGEPAGCGCQIPAGRRSPSMASVLGAFLLACGAIVARRRSA